jgi:hypothetical protein
VQLVAHWLSLPLTPCIDGIFFIVIYAFGRVFANGAPLAATVPRIGLANSFFHSAIQGWTTSVATTARAASVSRFDTSPFLGTGVAPGVTAALASEARFQEIFGANAAASFGPQHAAADASATG